MVRSKLVLTAAFLLSIVFVSCESEKYVRLSNEVIPKTVHITVVGSKDKKKGLIYGSGVFIGPKGYILTCAHLFNYFDKTEAISVTSSNYEIFGATIVKLGVKDDLAIIRAPWFVNNPYAFLADPRTLKVGQDVIAVGHPLGLDWSVTHGIISALYRDIFSQYNVTQSDTPINPGNSGGPLFNMKGEIVGINSFLVRGGNGLGFSVQSGQCLEFITGIDVLKFHITRISKKVNYGKLGVQLVLYTIMAVLIMWGFILWTYHRYL